MKKMLTPEPHRGGLLRYGTSPAAAIRDQKFSPTTQTSKTNQQQKGTS